MQKHNFEKFYTFTLGRDFKSLAANYAGRVGAAKAVVSLYLSCEENSFIEYGDFCLDGFEEEFNALLVADGYLDSDGGISDKVERILCWQLWVNFLDDGCPCAGVHLYDFPDDGIKEFNEFVTFANEERGCP